MLFISIFISWRGDCFLAIVAINVVFCNELFFGNFSSIQIFPVFIAL